MLSARRLAGLAVLALALFGCGQASLANGEFFARASPIPTPLGVPFQIGQVTYTNWGEKNVHGEETRGMDAGNFFFRGTFFRGNRGQTLTLEIQNVTDRVHNFSLPAQGIDQDIPPGSGRVNVAVTFPQSGGLRFFCKYHAAQGMNGLLVVGGARLQSVAIPSPSPGPQPAQ
jgi:plastocyanin